MKYKFLEHTADIKFQAYGKNLKECFSNAAYALSELIKGDIKIKAKIKKRIAIEGKDKESLLYSFLEEFLFFLDANDFLMSKIEMIKIDGKKLKAEISGDKASNYKFTNDVKAITYNEMFVKQEDKGKDKGLWVCQVVADV
jgi:SHS2 domain-containing protein